MHNDKGSTDNQPSSFWLKANVVYYIGLGLVGAAWIAQWHTFGISVGIVALVLAYFLFLKKKLAYFIAAAWCFGLLRIAMDDGYDFHQGYQSIAKLFYLLGVVFAIILHEKVAKKTSSSESKEHMPD